MLKHAGGCCTTPVFTTGASRQRHKADLHAARAKQSSLLVSLHGRRRRHTTVSSTPGTQALDNWDGHHEGQDETLEVIYHVYCMHTVRVPMQRMGWPLQRSGGQTGGQLSCVCNGNKCVPYHRPQSYPQPDPEPTCRLVEVSIALALAALSLGPHSFMA